MDCLPNHSHCFVRLDQSSEQCSKCGAKRARKLGHGYVGKDDEINRLKAFMRGVKWADGHSDKMAFITPDQYQELQELLK